MNINTIQALYEQLQVNERRNFCPRPGIYKIINTYQGSCYDKPAFMAKCYWRTTLLNNYEKAFVVTIQIESFKNNAELGQLALLNSGSLAGREIEVFMAEQDVVTHRLQLSWKFIELPKTDLNRLNQRLASGNLDGFNIDQMDDVCIDEEDDLIPEV